MEQYIKALTPNEEELTVPKLNVDNLVNDAWMAIKEELAKPIPTFGQAKWKDERRIAIKQILTDMQTELMQAKKAQTQDILKFGKALYQKAMKDANAIIERNKQLQKQNEQLTQENSRLKDRLSQVDETAIEKLRQQKDKYIRELQCELGRAKTDAGKAASEATQAKKQAQGMTEQLRAMLSVPEIKEIWDGIQQEKKALQQQVDRWIGSALNTIITFAKSGQSLFTREQDTAVRLGIIAQSFKSGLDSTDSSQRMKATHALLEQADWSDLTDYKINFARLRTEQTCNEMTVTKAVLESLVLAAGGRGTTSLGGGGTAGELTNWDGTKKKTGWGR